MNIGKLDRRITIEKQIESSSSQTGEVTWIWTSLATVWARVVYKDNSLKEDVEQGRQTSEEYVEFYIRYRSDVTTKMRVVYNDKNHNIINVREIGERKELSKLITIIKE